MIINITDYSLDIPCGCVDKDAVREILDCPSKLQDIQF